MQARRRQARDRKFLGSFGRLPGDPDRQQDGVLRIPALCLSVHAGLAHETQPPVQAVEKEAHVLHNEGPAPSGRRGLEELEPEELL